MGHMEANITLLRNLPIVFSKKGALLPHTQYLLLLTFWICVILTGVWRFFSVVFIFVPPMPVPSLATTVLV